MASLRQAAYDLFGAVDGALVESFALVWCILYLQSSFDMLHGRRYEANSTSCHHSSNCMTDCWKFVFCRVLDSIELVS